MTLFRALLAVLVVALALALPARAQDFATLAADRVEIRSENVLVAEGNVEVFWQGARLTASRLVYDSAADRLSIEGPITLTEPGGVALFAASAELSSDLREGIMSSARLLLSQQFQMAAVEIGRTGGRYTELEKVVASSCQVCPGNPVPLWSIRARRVVHDAEERQIYFDHAQFRVLGVPVAYIPRLRFPDPTLERATGFLFPTIRSTSELDTGLKIPYFITLGRSADLTLTPYVSPNTRTLEGRFRRAFRYGDVTVEAAVSNDDILPDETRYYVFADGSFVLPRDFVLNFSFKDVSDEGYLLDYGYSDADRLESLLTVERTRRDEYIEGGIRRYQTLRDSERNATQPTRILEGRYERRFVPPVIGGIATLGFDGLGSYRRSTTDVLGRDIARASAALAWERTELLGPGLLATGAFRVTAQSYAIEDDAAFPASVARVLPEAAVTLRWPLSRTEAGGAVQVLEPVAMLAWAPENPEPVPNEDSVLVEFDEANLLSFSRFPGEDARERGLRLAVGATWTRTDPAGWRLRLGFGRIFREDDTGEFGSGTGLDGDASDWLATAQLALPGSIDLTARALLDDRFGLTKGDLRLGYQGDGYALSTGLVLLSDSPQENRAEDIAEWTFNGSWRLHPNWVSRANWRYDFEADRATRAGLGLGYENECLRVDLSLSRRFSSSTTVRATTDFGLSVELLGFGTGGEGGAPRRRCVTY